MKVVEEEIEQKFARVNAERSKMFCDRCGYFEQCRVKMCGEEDCALTRVREKARLWP